MSFNDDSEWIFLGEVQFCGEKIFIAVIVNVDAFTTK